MSRESDRFSDVDRGPAGPLASRALLDAVPALVWQTDLAGRHLTFANAPFHAYAGAAAAVDDSIELAHPEDRELVAAAWRAARETHVPFALDYRLRRNDGAYRVHAVRVVPMGDASDDVAAWCAFAVDVDDARRDCDAFALHARSSSSLTWTMGGDGVVAFANPRFGAYFGARPREGERIDLASIVHADDLASVRSRWGEATVDGSAFETRCRLRREDGAYRWFGVRIVASIRSDGESPRYVGIATDVDDRERARIGLAYLDEVGDILGPAVDPLAAMQRVADRAVPVFADWCSIYLFDDEGLPKPVAIAHRDPQRIATAWQVVREYPPRANDPAMLRVGRNQSSLLRNISRDVLASTSDDPRYLDLLLSLGLRSAIVAPIVARGKPLGSINFVCGDDRELGTDEQRLAEIVGKRIGIAIENAHVFERERHISTTFQQAALSHVLPSVPGLDLHAVYVAAEREAEIGGDWYDAFTLEDGSVVISIGDVAGKGLEAAVLMGSLRQAIRVVALKGFGPAEILEATSLLVASESSERFATAFVGIVDPKTWSLRYASAAHPPPIFRRPDGTTLFLHVEASPPLGLIDETPQTAMLVSIPANSMLVLYTDGLIEATRDIFLGERRLHATVGSQAVLFSGDPARLIRDTVLHDGVHDDVAVLTIAFGRSKRWSFDARDAMSAHGARSSFLAALRAEGAAGGDYIGSEVIFGELIGNVVRHAPGPIDVTLDWDEREPILHVIDRGPGFVREPKLPDPLSESGRGLFIIDTLARGFQAAPIPGRGTHVIVRLPVERAEPPTPR